MVMGVRNAAEHLAETLESVIGQRDVEFELVIVDDGSTDRTPEILRRYASLYDCIRIFEQEHRGLTEALRLGCSRAMGRYIARQDAADLSLSGRLITQKDALDSDRSLAFVGCWTEFRGPRLEYLYTSRGRGGSDEPRRIISEAGGRPRLVDGPSHHGAVMFRTSHYRQVGGYREEFYLAQDADLWHRLAETGTYQCVPEVLYVARVAAGGRSLTYRKIQRRLGGLAQQAFERRQRGESEELILKRASGLRPTSPDSGNRGRAKAFYFIGEALRRNRDPRCVDYFKAAISAFPFHLTSWVRLLQVAVARATLRG